jgi:hypothetical protein
MSRTKDARAIAPTTQLDLWLFGARLKNPGAARDTLDLAMTQGVRASLKAFQLPNPEWLELSPPLLMLSPIPTSLPTRQSVVEILIPVSILHLPKCVRFVSPF